MKDASTELQALWAARFKQMDRQWHLNLELLRTQKVEKVQRTLNRLAGISLFTAGFYFLALCFFLSFAAQHWPSMPHLLAGCTLGAWSLYALISSAHEYTLVKRLDYTAPIQVLQQAISEVKLTMLRYIRLHIWVFPLYFSFVIVLFEVVWKVDIVALAAPVWLWANVGFSLGVVLPFSWWAWKKTDPINGPPRLLKSLLGERGASLEAAAQHLQSVREFETA